MTPAPSPGPSSSPRGWCGRRCRCGPLPGQDAPVRTAATAVRLTAPLSGVLTARAQTARQIRSRYRSQGRYWPMQNEWALLLGVRGGAGRVCAVLDDLVSDDLWERVAPLLPPRPPRRRRYPGRLPVDDRAALRGIVYVLCKGVSWRHVPAEQIGCSGVTCWRRLRDWTEAGVWPRLHEVLLAELRKAGLLDMDDAAVDGSHVRALKVGLTPDLRRPAVRVRAASTI